MASGKVGLKRSLILVGAGVGVFGLEKLLEYDNLAYRNSVLEKVHQVTHYLVEDSHRFQYIPFIAAGFAVYYLGKLALGR